MASISQDVLGLIEDRVIIGSSTQEINLRIGRGVLFVTSKRLESILRNSEFGLEKVDTGGRGPYLAVTEAMPSVEKVLEIVAKYQNCNIEEIIAIGGGSVLDCAKVVKRGLETGAKSFEDLNRKREGNFAEPIRFAVCPTTAGTGSESTPFATLWDFTDNIKLSVEGDDLIPTVVILDNAFLSTVPIAVAVASALDALSHALESIWNRNAQKESLEISFKALGLILDGFRSLRIAGSPEDPENMTKASEYFQIGSYLAGRSIAITRTAIAHSISYPVTTDLRISHGLAASFFLPEICHSAYKFDDGRMQKLDSFLQAEFSNKPLADQLYDVISFFGVSAHVKTRFKDCSVNIDCMTRRMFESTRADNFFSESASNEVREKLAKFLS